MNKKFSHLLSASICAVVILLFLYWMAGYSLISNPGFLLKRSESKEGLARQVIAGEHLSLDVPRVYVLPKNILHFFLAPYSYLHKRLHRELVITSFSNPEEGIIVLMEDATLDDFYHELGHLAHRAKDPAAYAKKSFGDKELFAADFASVVREKYGH